MQKKRIQLLLLSVLMCLGCVTSALATVDVIVNENGIYGQSTDIESLSRSYVEPVAVSTQESLFTSIDKEEAAFYAAGNELYSELLSLSLSKTRNGVNSNFAGAYFDNENQTFVILVTANVSRMSMSGEDTPEKLASTLFQLSISDELSGKVEIKEADYTYSELLNTLNRVDDVITKNGSLGGGEMLVSLDIASYGINEEVNRIVVRIYNINDAKINAFKETVFDSPMIEYVNVNGSYEIESAYVEDYTQEEVISNIEKRDIVMPGVPWSGDHIAFVSKTNVIGGGAQGTLGVPARNNRTGAIGFLTSTHGSVYNYIKLTTNGSTPWTTTVGQYSHHITGGTVDAAFYQASVTSYGWLTATVSRASTLARNTKVMKYHRNSPNSSIAWKEEGYVLSSTERGAMVTPNGAVSITDLFMCSYKSDAGCSGAPVYVVTSAGAYQFIGIHIAKFGDALVCKTANIESALNVTIG